MTNTTQSKPKSNSVITHTIDAEARRIVFAIRDALGPDKHGELTLSLADVSQKVLDRAVYHGLIQRISDAAAISRNTETGKPASPKDKMDAMAGLVEHYASGAEEWTMARAGGGAQAGSGLLLDALCELYPTKSREALRERVKGWTAAQRAAMLLHDSVKPIADRLRAKAVEHVDAETLLSALDE